MKFLPRYENAVSIDPDVKDKWGVPVLRFNYKFGDNEKKMAADMAVAAREMFEASGIEVVSVDRRDSDRGLVHSRTGNVAHGKRSENLGAQPIPAGA